MPPVSAPSPSIPAPISAASGRILLVEDEPTNMAILSAYLRSAGYGVVEAQDGAKAWDVLAADPLFDLLVTDRRMPNMDGLALAARLRKERALRHIPVIMQTSASAQDEILEGIKAGVYYYLIKPYEESTLLAIVRSALQERRQQELFEQRILQQRGALGSFVKGEFFLRTPAEAENVALLLGCAFERPEQAASGFYELLLNAIEHGNLGIGYELKGRLLEGGQWEQEIARRLALPENSGKKVFIQFAQSQGQIEVLIGDDGPGFDWRPFLEIEPSRATQSNGRGIAKANLLSFDRLDYQGNGNQVKILLKHPAR